MRKIIYLILLSFPLFIGSSNEFDNPSDYFPVLMERSELEKSVFYRTPQDIVIKTIQFISLKNIREFMSLTIQILRIRKTMHLLTFPDVLI